MKIALNKAHFPVTVLGPGRRIGIWFQGCSIGCKGCISQDTWTSKAEEVMTVSELMQWCRQTSGGLLDGVTLSGGEPFDQPRALSSLLDALAEWRATLASPFDILCYSGYPYARLLREHPGILDKLDALIPEPFVQTKPATHLWRGSSNQPLIALSARAQALYGPFLEATQAASGKQIQIAVDGSRIWYIGIPGRGDMAALEASCAAQGLTFQSVSWRQ
jgi:anaerobic ribonucleoside-triphosphate reductase activating protein